MSGGRESFGSVSVHAGEGARVDCSAYEQTTPILSVYAGPLIVDISIADRTAISAHAVTFARELSRQAARFAAECERLHTAQHPQAPANAEAPGEVGCRLRSRTVRPDDGRDGRELAPSGRPRSLPRLGKSNRKR